MVITNLLLRGFRNLSRISISPNPKLNIIFGPNGSGKTNFCEAIHFVSRGKTLKGVRQQELIGWNKKDSLVRLTLSTDDTLVVYLKKGEKKRLQINSKQTNQAELNNLLQVLTFVPDDLYSVKGSPGQRRELINDHLSSVDSDYRHLLTNYQKELKKKNALLKKETINDQFLEVLNSRLAQMGAEVMKYRAGFIQNLNPSLASHYRKFAPGSGKLKLDYLDLTDLGTPEEEIERQLKRMIKKNKDKELRLSTSVIGPHRDKIEYKLGGHRLRKYGSQGEQRSAVIATYLSLLQIYRDNFQRWPVLILDDIISELDRSRTKMLLNNFPHGPQIYFTATEKSPFFDRLNNDKSVFKITEGKLKQIQ